MKTIYPPEYSSRGSIQFGICMLFAFLITACARTATPISGLTEIDAAVNPEETDDHSGLREEPEDIGPALEGLNVNGMKLASDKGVYSIDEGVNPGDKLEIRGTIRDDESGTFEVLGQMDFYSPEEGSAEAAVTVIVPAELIAAELPIFLGEERAGVLVFEPGSQWAPIILVEDPTGLTGDVVLEVSVTDLDGSDTVQSLSVEQEFNFQHPDHADEILADAGGEPIGVAELPSGITEVRFSDARFDFLFTANKEIQEYISNNSLAPIEVVRVESEHYEIRFSSEWPGRFQLHLSAVDLDGNETTELVPVEVNWAEQPWEWRGIAIETAGFGDLSMVPSLIDHAKQNNMNFIIFSPHWVTVDSSNEIFLCSETNVFCLSPTDEQLAQWIDYAHDKEFAVLLAPHLTCDDSCQPYDIQPPDWEEWFSNYGALTLRLARLAQEHDVEAFSIGDELTSTHPQRTQWEGLLSSVKEAYDGQVTYMDFTYWTGGGGFLLEHDLSFLGVNAFYPGAAQGNNDPSVLDMEPYIDTQMQRLLVPRMLASQREAVATSLGRAPHDGTAYDPWATQRPVDNQEQLDYFEAAFRNASRYFTGIAVWAYEVTPENQLYDRSFDPRGKPLEDLLRIWFAKPSRSE